MYPGCMFAWCILHVSTMHIYMILDPDACECMMHDAWTSSLDPDACMYDARMYDIYLWSSFPDLDACMIHECMMHISMISVPDVCMMRISVILVPGPDACMMRVSWCLSVWCILLLLLLPLKIGSKNVTDILLMGGAAAAGADKGILGVGYKILHKWMSE